MCKPLIAAITATAALACVSNASADFFLTYDASTGELAVETGSNAMFNYIIQGSSNADPNDGFIEENALPLPGTYTPTATDDELSGSLPTLTGWVLPTPTSLGNVLAPNLTEQQFDAAITSATYADAFGSQAFFDFETRYVPVPEPTSLVLLAGGAALFARRRRR